MADLLDLDRPAMLHRLGLNESPFGPLPAVSAAIAGMIPESNRYPEFYPERLTEVIATWLGVDGDRVAVGAGSVGVALQAFQAMTEPGQAVVYGWPNFDAYPLLAEMAGARGIGVPLSDDGSQDLDKLLGAVTPTVRIVVLCNPHNPTGSLTNGSELRAFLRRIPDDVLVILDEAYIEFADGPDLPDALALQSSHPNLLVLRTFSKAYGLAALRVGYAIGTPGIIKLVRARQLPFGINAFAFAAVDASLRSGADLRHRVEVSRTHRQQLHVRLRLGGWRVFPSQANFLWLAEPRRVEECRVRLRNAGVVARFYPGQGVRLTVGDRTANDAAVAALTA